MIQLISRILNINYIQNNNEKYIDDNIMMDETANETTNETTNETANETTNETANETTNETVNETDNNIVYIIKVNNSIKCFCNTVEEVEIMMKCIINKLKYNLFTEGWNNIECVSKDNKILWKIIEPNRVVAHITGNKYNSLIFHEQILCDIEVEIIKKYNDDFF